MEPNRLQSLVIVHPGAGRLFFESSSRSISFFEHDLFGKPVSTFPDHALAKTSGVIMIRRFVGIAALVAAVALPVVAQAQGVPGGIERGSRDGERAAGAVGAVVGGVIGGVLGGVGGILGVDERPRFRNYAAEQHRPSYQY